MHHDSSLVNCTLFFSNSVPGLGGVDRSTSGEERHKFESPTDSDHEELDGNKSRPSGEGSKHDYDHEIDSRRSSVRHLL